VRNAVWVLVTVVLLLGLPFVGLANHEDVEETAMGFGFGGPLIGLFVLDPVSYTHLTLPTSDLV